MSNTDDKMLRIPADAHQILKAMAYTDKRSMAQEAAWLIEREAQRRGSSGQPVEQRGEAK